MGYRNEWNPDPAYIAKAYLGRSLISKRLLALSM